MPELSIVIPVYNEEKHVKNTVNELCNSFLGSEISYEVVLVDDGSTDNSLKEIKEISKEFDNIRYYSQQNGGKGSALILGANNANGELIGFIDADLDLHPEQLLSYFHLLKETNSDIIIGSKRHPDSSVIYPFKRKLLSRLYQTFLICIFHLNVSDTQVGIKLFRREVLNQILPKIIVKKYAFDLEVLVNAHHMGYKITEAPVNLNFVRFSSRINRKDVEKMLIDTLAIWYRLYIIRYYDK